VQGEERLKKRLEQLEVEGIGGVGFGVGRVVVDFEEEAVDAGGDGGAGEERDELGLAAADSVGGRRLLDRVRGIENHGRELAHEGKRAKINDEVVVAERRAALREEDALVACGADLFDAMMHVPRGNELAFLDVDGAAGAACGDEQVGLAAEEGGNLQDIDCFGGDFAVARLMNVRENRQAGIFGNAGEDARAFNQARAAKALDAGAVGLVVAGFEDEGDMEIGGNALNGVSHGAGMRLGLDDTGARNEKETACPHMHGANFEGWAHDTHSIALVA